MRNRVLSLATRIGIVMLALAALTVGATAQNPTPTRLCGLIHDYAATTGGPWEIEGTWCLKIHGDSSKADFSAALAMEGVSDVNSAAARHAHTHHIKIENGTILASPDGNGFLVTGDVGFVTVTGNGKAPDFEPPPSTLQVKIFGGDVVPFSNIQLTFGGGAMNHFGPLPINGVVRKTGNHEDEHPDER